MSKMFTLAFLALLAPAALAKHPMDDSTDVDVDFHSDGKVSIKSKSKDSNSKQELEIRVEGEEHGIDTKFRYKADSTSSKTTSSFRAKIYSIVEFVDANNNGFDSNDTLVQRVPVGDSYSATEGTEGEMKTVTIKDEGDSGVSVKVYIADKPTTVPGSEEISGNKIKLDVMISDFPYLQNGTKLAFEGRFKSKNKVNSKGEKALVTKIDTGNDSDDVNAGFGWANSATVDGVDVALTESVVEAAAAAEDDPSKGADEQEFKKYWTINKVGMHKNIVWDPTVGFDEDSSAMIAAPLALLGLLYLF